MIEEIVIGGVVLGAVGVAGAALTYRIVPPTEAHLVVTPSERFVVSPDEKIGDKKTYFAIPSFVPFVGRQVRIMDMTIKEIVIGQETYEKGNARYHVKSSTKYRVQDVKRAAETFTDDADLQNQLTEIIASSVRAVTVKYDVTEARASKKKMGEEIQEEMVDDLAAWGLILINFQLVDFQDTDTSKIVSNISLRREVEIESQTREQNAAKIQFARVKEAEAEQNSRQREIEKDKQIGVYEQERNTLVSAKEKVAQEQAYEVIKVKTIKQTEINKEQAKIQAEQRKEVEAINKEQKKLEGEGDKLKQEQQALGEAAPIREKLFAEAAGKEKLQQALNKFTDKAIRALIAEQLVEANKAVGMEGAKALAQADVRLFSGGSADGSGFEVGKMIQSMATSSTDTAAATLNKLGMPNDLGFKEAFAVSEELQSRKKKRKTGAANSAPVQ